MMKPYFHKITRSLLFIAFIGTQGCDIFCIHPACGGDDPANNLPWLSSLINETDQFDSYSWFKRFTYQGETYFIQGSCCLNCLWIPIYYTCEGTVVEFGENDSQKVLEIWQNSGEVVWQGGKCNF